MHVLLTGGTGFIGSHLLRRLVYEGCQVTMVIRPGADLRRVADVVSEVRLIEGDLLAPDTLVDAVRQAPPEVCLHLAWYVVPGQYVQSLENVTWVAASMNLLQLLADVDCRRTIIAGTCFEYDLDIGYLAETSPVRPQVLYSAAKHALYLMAEQYQRNHGRSLAWPRLFYQYGPGEASQRLVPMVIGKLLAGEPCLLPPGDQIRDYLHVEDVASALWEIARSDLEGPVNIGSSVPISVAGIAREIASLVGRIDLLQLGAVPPRVGDPPFICANTARLRGVTGWRPVFSLRAGLEQTIDWWQTSGRGSLVAGDP